LNLVDIVDALPRPAAKDGLYAAQALQASGRVRVGIDAGGYPAIFLEIRRSGEPRRPFVLAALTYNPEVICRFSDDEAEHRCSVLRCTSSERDVRELFLRVAASWLPTIPTDGVGVEIDSAVARLVDLFDALESPARGDVLGLWGELFVILAADDRREILKAWRCDPFELHDFVATSTRLEVKTSTGIRRHQFSLEQLRPPAGMSLIVGSVLTKQSTRGVTVSDLKERLVNEMNDAALAFRIEQTIAFTLGDRWAETTTQKFSWELACETLAFYDGATVPCINPQIPPEVSQVRFAVELDSIPPLESVAFPGLGSLLRLRR
jgi:hypothetical protein